MDVLHISEFGRLTYVHVNIDTFPHAVHAIARTEEIKDVIQHLLASLKVFFKKKKPKLQTNNGPAYTSQSFKRFYKT